MQRISASGVALAVLLAVLPAVPAAAAPPPTVAAADRQLTFTVAGTLTYGTVHVPAHRAGQRLPAALLLPGSGPTDRNGDQLPDVAPHTLAQLAAALGRDGVMTLRFDKVGSGQTGIGAFWSHPQDLDFPAVVGQAVAAYGVLRDQPEADRSSLLVIGHSEGGLTGLLVAQRATPHPVGVGLLAPQSLRILDHIRTQLGRQLTAAVRLRQLTPAQERQISAAVTRAVADLRAHRAVDPARLPPQVASIFAVLQGVNLRYTRSDDAVDPAVVARGLPAGTRVLLLCGGADTQVTCADTNALAATLRGRTTGPGRVEIAGVDHYLSVSARPLVLAPLVLRTLHDFVTAR